MDLALNSSEYYPFIQIRAHRWENCIPDAARNQDVQRCIYRRSDCCPDMGLLNKHSCLAKRIERSKILRKTPSFFISHQNRNIPKYNQTNTELWPGRAGVGM